MGEHKGHVFLTMGDIRMFCCDAWVVPYHGDSVSEVWFQPYLTAHGFTTFEESNLKIEFTNEQYPTLGRVTNWDTAWPIPYIVSSRQLTLKNNLVDCLCTSVSQMVKCFYQDFSESGTTYGRNKRDRPLVAVPVLGTNKLSQGLLLNNLMITLVSLVKQFRLDIVLVTFETNTFHIAQSIRQRQKWKQQGMWFFPTEEERKNNETEEEKRRVWKLRLQAKRLAKKALDQKLVLFIGAGVSIGAGLPSWSGLLDYLASTCNIDAKSTQWRSLDVLNKANLIQLRLSEKGEKIGDHISKFMDKPHHCIMHSLLASLPCNHVVTTNYDVLFEMAWRGRRVENYSVLPYYPKPKTTKWILKMHGCLSQPKDIVLTRNDYLKYMEQHAALAGIVQTMLLVSHLFFVGFSLQDDNFHRIMHEVRKATMLRAAENPTALSFYHSVPKKSNKQVLHQERKEFLTRINSSSRNSPISVNSSPDSNNETNLNTNNNNNNNHNKNNKNNNNNNDNNNNSSNKERKNKILKRHTLGTSTQLFKNPYHQELWDEDLSFANMNPWKTNPDESDWARSGRDLEIFLDYLLYKSSSTSTHILDHRFTGILTKQENALANSLHEFLSIVANKYPSSVDCNAFRSVEHLFSNLGQPSVYSLLGRYVNIPSPSNDNTLENIDTSHTFRNGDSNLNNSSDSSSEENEHGIQRAANENDNNENNENNDNDKDSNKENKDKKENNGNNENSIKDGNNGNSEDNSLSNDKIENKVADDINQPKSNNQDEIKESSIAETKNIQVLQVVGNEGESEFSLMRKSLQIPCFVDDVPPFT